MNIKKGNIIRVKQPIYIDYIGGKWSDHFVDKNILWLVLENPTNNGNFQAINTKGIKQLFNAADKNIIEIAK